MATKTKQPKSVKRKETADERATREQLAAVRRSLRMQREWASLNEHFADPLPERNGTNDATDQE